MITHIVLFKLKDPSPENLAETAAVLRGMEGKIPALLAIEVGIDSLRTERSFDIALRTQHASWAELEAYQKHPIHEKVIEHMQRVRDRSVSVDWES